MIGDEAAIRKSSEPLPILDRFHIVAKMNQVLDEVRAGESRRHGHGKNLKAEQRFRLRDFLRCNLRAVRA